MIKTKEQAQFGKTENTVIGNKNQKHAVVSHRVKGTGEYKLINQFGAEVRTSANIKEQTNDRAGMNTGCWTKTKVHVMVHAATTMLGSLLCTEGTL